MNRVIATLFCHMGEKKVRHTAYGSPYICMRLLEGADSYQIAKNCWAGVEMIVKHYAERLKKHIGCFRY